MNVDRTIQRIRRRAEILNNLNRKTIKCGWFSESQYEDNVKVAQVAFYNEFGTATIPPRPFFRPCISENKEKWKESIKRGINAVENGQIDAGDMLNQIGLMMQTDLQESIIKVNSPELSPITLMLRKWKNSGQLQQVRKRDVWKALKAVKDGEDYSSAPNKPLQDTGRLLASVQYKIK